MTTYVICGRSYEGAEESERVLSSLFFDMCRDLGIDYGQDHVAWRECFNDWTDSLCKDDLICEASYKDLCPIGERFE